MKIIPTEVKIKFRNLEKISLKYSASKAHRQFNITCINNKLLPIYTNIYIYICKIICKCILIFNIMKTPIFLSTFKSKYSYSNVKDSS